LEIKLAQLEKYTNKQTWA